MHCHVLGATGSRPGRGQPCSGYLVSTASTTILVDCGFGVATALTGRMDPAALDAIVITHRHLDHCVDLLGIWAVVRRTDARVPVYAADEVAETLQSLVTDNRQPEFEARLPMHPLRPGARVVVGDLHLTAHASDHPVPTVSLRIEDTAGAVLAYSSDSGGGGDLVACATDADLFLCEASWQEREEDRGGDGHMTARRAGEVATEAGVGALVLTHLRPHLDASTSVAEARGSWAGPLDVAAPGDDLAVAARHSQSSSA